MRWLHRLHFELSYILGAAPWDRGVSPPELIAFLDSHPSGRALDIGCGTGTNALTMAGRGWDVQGIDFSARAIRAARRKARLAGLSVSFDRADISRLAGLCGPFDFALDIGCYHGLSTSQQAEYALDLATLLRPGATFLIYGFTDPEPGAGWRVRPPRSRGLGRRFSPSILAWGSMARRSRPAVRPRSSPAATCPLRSAAPTGPNPTRRLPPFCKRTISSAASWREGAPPPSSMPTRPAISMRSIPAGAS